MSFLTYARLLRLPNVFTAWADIGMTLCAVVGYASLEVDANLALRAGLLLIASGCLYCGGMVWNDYFDLEEDRRDRPFRPLASGRISLAAARSIGIFLMVVGWGCAALDPREDNLISLPGLIVGGILVVAVVLYDARIKRTSFGPIGMASCRFLNVLLGLTIADVAAMSWPVRLHLASVIGIYIVGVTWFARTEEKRSDPKVLGRAAVVMLVALIVALPIPLRLQAGSASVLFPYLLVVFGFLIGFPALVAIQKPTPEHVQKAVKRCILGLVGLDAILATAFVGSMGLLLLLLLPPALVIGKWVYST
jgi:4-hydroxybenzoate polyprenyltransferase